MSIQKYKTIKKYQTIMTLLALFIPMPLAQCEYTPDFVIKGWGFGYTIAVTEWKIPLGWIMIIISMIF